MIVTLRERFFVYIPDRLGLIPLPCLLLNLCVDTYLVLTRRSPIPSATTLVLAHTPTPATTLHFHRHPSSLKSPSLFSCCLMTPSCVLTRGIFPPETLQLPPSPNSKTHCTCQRSHTTRALRPTKPTRKVIISPPFRYNPIVRRLFPDLTCR